MQRRKYNSIQKGNEVETIDEPNTSVTEQLASGMQIVLKNKIRHYELYSTDGYINILNGAHLPGGDNTSIAGWGTTFNGPADAPENLFPVTGTPGPITGPVYIWGFTDIDPDAMDVDPTGGSNNLMKVPTNAIAVAGTPVGNAKFPAPFLDVKHMQDIFVTLHNRGFYQNLQTVQDDHSLHWHGIHAQTQYDGFPESAGGYVENLRYFWQEEWYKRKGNSVPVGTRTTTKERDDWWNSLGVTAQQDWLNKNAPGIIKKNRLNPSGGVINKRNRFPIATDKQNYPFGVNDIPNDAAHRQAIEDVTQFTYYFTTMNPGTYMYHCHVSASEHVQMGMYGALVVRPMDYVASDPNTWSVLGKGTNTDYNEEYTHILSEFDARWHRSIEGDPAYANYYPAQWRPDLWFVNGRTFPQNVLPFAWNKLVNKAIVPEYEPKYNTFIKVNKAKDKFLIRYIQMGYQSVPQHQHGWHMRIVSKDARPIIPQREEYTLFMGSGETWDTITTADPVYGVTATAGSPLSIVSAESPSTKEPKGTLKWRVVYPIHNHNDYTVTTNGFYPGGAVVLIEVCIDAASVPKLPPLASNPNAAFYLNNHIGRPSWEDAYVTLGPAPGRAAIVELVSPCPNLPPH